jgi:hypothetical protein
MAQDKIESLLRGLSLGEGASTRVVLTNDPDKLINSIRKEIKSVEIISDLKSVSQSVKVSVMIIDHHQTEDWYEQLDREIEERMRKKEINHSLILLIKDEKEYVKTLRFMPQTSSKCLRYVIAFPKFTDLLVDKFGSVEGFCDFVEENYK